MRQTAPIQSLIHFAGSSLPLFNLGFAWVPFAFIGFVLGIAAYVLVRRVPSLQLNPEINAKQK